LLLLLIFIYAKPPTEKHLIVKWAPYLNILIIIITILLIIIIIIIIILLLLLSDMKNCFVKIRVGYKTVYFLVCTAVLGNENKMTATCWERMQQNISAQKVRGRGHCITNFCFRQRRQQERLHFGPDGHTNHKHRNMK